MNRLYKILTNQGRQLKRVGMSVFLKKTKKSTGLLTENYSGQESQSDRNDPEEMHVVEASSVDKNNSLGYRRDFIRLWSGLSHKIRTVLGKRSDSFIRSKAEREKSLLKSILRGRESANKEELIAAKERVAEASRVRFEQVKDFVLTNLKVVIGVGIAISVAFYQSAPYLGEINKQVGLSGQKELYTEIIEEWEGYQQIRYAPMIQKLVSEGKSLEDIANYLKENDGKALMEMLESFNGLDHELNVFHAMYGSHLQRNNEGMLVPAPYLGEEEVPYYVVKRFKDYGMPDAVSKADSRLRLSINSWLADVILPVSLFTLFYSGMIYLGKGFSFRRKKLAQEAVDPPVPLYIAIAKRVAETGIPEGIESSVLILVHEPLSEEEKNAQETEAAKTKDMDLKEDEAGPSMLVQAA